MDDVEYQTRLRHGTLPLIITDTFNYKIRTWVNSEKFPWFSYDGFRVLHHGTIFERKKSWWIFGKWIIKRSTIKDIQVCVLDECLII